jgi:hypothetical protein
MLEEMKAIEDNETWELVDPLPSCRPIGLKWVYKAKRDEHRAIVKNKARLVARGFIQREGIDFEEVFAPVAHMESVRLLLALATAKDWRVHHLDVKSVFLNGELAKTVFVKQAPGVAVKGAEHKVLRLLKALYGLRQARGRGTPRCACLGEHAVQQSTRSTCGYGEGGARLRRVCGRHDHHRSAREGHRRPSSMRWRLGST